MEVSIDVVEKTVVVEEEVVVLTLTRREAVALRTLADLHENGVYSYYATGKSHFGGALFAQKLHDAGIHFDAELERAVRMFEKDRVGFDNAVAHLPNGN